MLGYILKRLLLAVPTLFAVLTIVFVLARVLPGDPAQTILGDQASQEALAAMRHRLGVDKPILAQYVDFLLNALQGEWGNSLVTGKPVAEEVRNVLPYTVDLTVTSIVLGALIGAAPQHLGRLWRAHRLAARPVVSCLRFRDPAAARLRHPAPLVPGDQRR